MAYDQASGQLVLFGGLAADNATALGDTWVYNGTTWTELSPPATPGPRSDASLTYDPTLGELVLFGGFDVNCETPSGTLWTFNGTTWTPMGPPARSDYAVGLRLGDQPVGDLRGSRREREHPRGHLGLDRFDLDRRSPVPDPPDAPTPRWPTTRPSAR